VKDVSLDLVGKWVLNRSGNFEPAINVAFAKDGTFAFQCSNATSKGKYLLEGKAITLVWTEVDGDKVELGSMKKSILINDDGSFSIDQFRYIKS
ncbi:MAG: hypothetical protein ABL962_12330, partial [Fimbriimonadaceae bacterium]